VVKGEAVAEIIDPVEGGSQLLVAPQSGIILTSTGTRFVVTGVATCRIAR
jgi:predicted deacylase